MVDSRCQQSQLTEIGERERGKITGKMDWKECKKEEERVREGGREVREVRIGKRSARIGEQRKRNNNTQPRPRVQLHRPRNSPQSGLLSFTASPTSQFPATSITEKARP